MSILEGVINNKVIHGANGDFSVGSFTTFDPFADLKIKSNLLDQYDEGEYRVKVNVTRIRLNSYQVSKNGFMVTEILAEIDALEVLDESIKPIELVPFEPDASIDTEESKSTGQKQERSKDITNEKPAGGKIILSNKKQTSPDVTDGQLTVAELKSLFGHLWPLADVVKLDGTTPRPIFIRQGNYLRKDYQFNSRSQTWHKK